MKRYFVTGHQGTIGRNLCKALIAAGHEVCGLDNGFRSEPFEMPGLVSIRGDVRHAGFVKHASKGADAVVHLAYVNGTQNFYDKPELVIDVAVRGMLSVLDACRENKIRELHVVSSSEVYQDAPVIPTAEDAPYHIPDPLNPRFSYAGGKIASELLAINCGRSGFDRVCIIRPNNVIGPQMGVDHVVPQMVLRMKELHEKTRPGEPIVFPIQGSGEETRSFCWIDDLVSALMIVLEKGQHLNIYHAGDVHELKISSLAQMIGACFGRQVVVKPGELQKGSPKRRCPDIRKLQALGYEPKMPLYEGINLVVRWYCENS